MKEFIVNTFCDECSREGRQEPATTTPAISLGAAKPRTLDLCETHHKELLGALTDVLDRDGVRVQDDAPAKTKKKSKRSGRAVTNKTPGPFMCEVRGCPGLRGHRGPAYPYLGSLKNHVTYAHELTWVEYVDQYGEPEALAEDASGTTPEPDPEPLWSEPSPQSEPKKEEVACGVGDCTYTSSRPQALGGHRAKAHGVKGASKRTRERDQQKKSA